MSRVHCHIWRRLRRHAKVRLAEVWVVHEDLRIRMIRYRPSRDWSVALCASTDDFPRARRTRGWKNHKHRHQWERRVRQLEKRGRSNARKHRTDRPEERSMPMYR